MSLSSFTRISLLVLFSFAWVAHAQVNPNYPNIRWALATGSGAPSGGACTSANYGQPYTQTTGPHQFVCTPAGWYQTDNGGSGVGFLPCSDTSGSGTAQNCTTSPSFTPAANSCVVYTTTTTNSGTGLTVNVNSLGAKSVAVPGSSGWTATLVASVIPTGKPLLACYDGTNWDVVQTGKISSSGGGGCFTTGAAGEIPYNDGTSGSCDLDPDATLDGAGNQKATSQTTTGSGAGYSALGCGSATIPGTGITLPTTFSGMIAPVSCLISTFFQMPSTNNSSPGLMLFAPPTTVNGQSQSAQSWIYAANFGSAYLNSLTGCSTSANPYVPADGQCEAPGGGGASFPFDIVQSDANPAITSSSSTTYAFPAALQASGTTAIVILGVDASASTWTCPSGWTCGVNEFNGTNYPRLVVALKASAGDTNIVWNDGSSGAVESAQLFELTGTRSFDVTNVAYISGSPTAVTYPSITPAANSAIFAVCTLLNNNAQSVARLGSLARPDWNAIDVISPNTNQRVQIGGVYLYAAAASVHNVPAARLNFTDLTGSGASCATFSIK